MKKERLLYLDAARGLAILLVVLGHIWETDQPLPVLIYAFHIPLFFVISGILTAHTGQEHRPAKQLVLSKLFGLIVPYVFFEIVFLVIFGLRNRFDFSSQHAHVYDGLFLSPLNVPLWFLPTLFLTELFLLFLLRTIRSRKCAALICLVLYLIPFVPGCSRVLPDALLRCLSSVGFLAAGYFSADLFLRKNPPWYVLLPTAAAGGVLAWLNGKTGIYKLTFHNPLLFTVCALALSCCTIYFLKKLAAPCTQRPGFRDSANSGIASAPGTPASTAAPSFFTAAADSGRRLLLTLLTLAGRNSLTILGLHIIVLRVLQEILGLRTDSIPGGLLALAGICVLLAPVCWFMNRFLPFLIGKRSPRAGQAAKCSKKS